MAALPVDLDVLTDAALDHVLMRHSTRFPTLCTVTVNAQIFSPDNSPACLNISQGDWRLPTNDPRDESHDPQRLHTLDIYFWTVDDANVFLDSVEAVLSRTCIETDRHYSHSNADNTMSPVVQQLENAAVADSAYQSEQARHSQFDNDSNLAPWAPNTSASALPPPPPGGPPSGQQAGVVTEQPNEKQAPAPLPYNPAAPSAPEPIQHREKTPPPVDGDTGTGLAAAVAADHGMPYSSQTPGGGSGTFAPPPTQALHTPSSGAIPTPPSATMPGTYASPPPSAGLTHTNTFPSTSQSPPHPHPQRALSYSSSTSSYNQPPTPGQMSFAPPPKDPNAHFYGQNFYAAQQQQQQQPTPPVGGYSSYSYEQQLPPQSPSVGGVGDYEVHSQVYRPTEAEANSHYQKYAQQAMRKPGQRPRKLEDGAARVESGVNRFLRKLEKKI